MRITTKYGEGEVTLAQFANGRPCLMMGDARIGINLPSVVMASHEVAVKDYSECEGTLDALVAAGIVSAPIAFIPSGHVAIPLCNLLVRLPAYGR